MSVLSDLANSLKASLVVAQTAQASYNDVVARHEALIAEVEKADAAVPTLTDVQELLARVAAVPK